jgi:exo-1,4-beta-D-glucosaminidase
MSPLATSSQLAAGIVLLSRHPHRRRWPVGTGNSTAPVPTTLDRSLRAWLGGALLACLTCASVATSSASASTITLGLAGWQVQSSALAPQPGAQISAPGFPTASWLAVEPDDAGAVGTEIGALLQNGSCPEVFFSENMKSCFGYMSAIGADTVPQFAVPWWFRTNFEADLQAGEHAQLIVNGIVGEADLWMNGHELATRASVQGAYARYSFDVTRLIQPGVNTLALEVYPNDPKRMFTLDDADWNQIPPDDNTGIQFPIELHLSHALAIGDVHVLEKNARNLSSSRLTLVAEVSNESGAPATGAVTATVTPPSGGGAAITLAKTVELPAGATRRIAFAPGEYPQLDIVHPQVWWPYQMGAQPLYGLAMAVSGPGAAPDTQAETFGIRTISSTLVDPSPMAPHGVRQFAINGRPFVFRAGGFSEDLFLRYSAAATAEQIALIKNLGLNGIRTEGKEMPQDFYEQMDRAGILIDAGFQCCDAWQPEGSTLPAHDYQVIYASALAIGEQLRNHPSVMDFSWSDDAPTPRQEAASLKGFAQADFQDPLIASAEYNGTARLGSSGEKEGPYDWVPPSYWYDTTHYNPSDPTRTNVGGSWGFDSEASAGDTVPTLDSIERFMSPFEQQQLWTEPAFNQYHTNYEPDLPNSQNQGYSFGTLFELDRAISHRFGSWSSLAQYVQEAQVQNYETQRAEFEAYIDHSTNRPTPSTGIVYWQLNKGVPTLLWDLYNEEFDEAGSYFGAKEANAPLHALYAYDENSVTVDNLTDATESGLTLQAKVYALGGQLLDEQTVNDITLGPQGVANGLINPKIPAATAPPATAKTYFIELLLERAGAVVDRNVYWLSTQPDVVDWPASEGHAQATMSQYADLTELRELPAATLRVSAHTEPQAGPAGSDTLTSVTVTNVSTTPTVAFFLRADVRRGSAEGTPAGGQNEVLPTFWSDNDTTLWPGESETLTAAYASAELAGEAPVVSVSGWNVPTIEVPAP